MALTAVVDRNPGRRGATLMRAIDAHPQRTRSDLCSSQRTRPTSPGRGRKLIVETDGHAAHRTEEAFEADRLRDRDTLRAGFRTIRLTGEAMAGEAAVARDLAAQLDA